MSTETPTPAPAASPTLQVGPYCLDPLRDIVTIGGEKQVPLTRFEMALLVHLASRSGEIVGKEELTRLMYSDNGRIRPESNGLEVFVGRIRRKIDPDGQRRPLETVRHSGYRFRTDWEQVAA